MQMRQTASLAWLVYLRTQGRVTGLSTPSNYGTLRLALNPGYAGVEVPRDLHHYKGGKPLKCVQLLPFDKALPTEKDTEALGSAGRNFLWASVRRGHAGQGCCPSTRWRRQHFLL